MVRDREVDVCGLTYLRLDEGAVLDECVRVAVAVGRLPVGRVLVLLLVVVLCPGRV